MSQRTEGEIFQSNALSLDKHSAAHRPASTGNLLNPDSDPRAQHNSVPYHTGTLPYVSSSSRDSHKHHISHINQLPERSHTLTRSRDRSRDSDEKPAKLESLGTSNLGISTLGSLRKSSHALSSRSSHKQTSKVSKRIQNQTSQHQSQNLTPNMDHVNHVVATQGIDRNESRQSQKSGNGTLDRLRDKDRETGLELSKRNISIMSTQSLPLGDSADHHNMSKSTYSNLNSTGMGDRLDNSSNRTVGEHDRDHHSNNPKSYNNSSRHTAEHLKALKINIDAMILKMEENRNKHARPFVVKDMSDSQLTREKQELQQLLLKFEDQFGRPKERIEKDIVRVIYDRYRQVKRALTQRSEQGQGDKNTVGPGLSIVCDAV